MRRWGSQTRDSWRTHPYTDQELLESKNVSPLNRVYPRPVGLARERLFRLERAAARNRVGYRWRQHRRALKSVWEGIPREAAHCQPTANKSQTNPVQQKSTGVDSLRRERGDNCDQMRTETLETGTDTIQGGQNISTKQYEKKNYY